MSMISGAIKDAGVSAIAIACAGGIPGVGMYLGVRALRGAVNGLAKEHDPANIVQSKNQDNGNQINTTA